MEIIPTNRSIIPGLAHYSIPGGWITKNLKWIHSAPSHHSLSVVKQLDETYSFSSIDPVDINYDIMI